MKNMNLRETLFSELFIKLHNENGKGVRRSHETAAGEETLRWSVNDQIKVEMMEMWLF